MLCVYASHNSTNGLLGHLSGLGLAVGVGKGRFLFWVRWAAVHSGGNCGSDNRMARL
jgi:hypothetical protein